MGNVAGLLVGIFFIAFALVPVGASLFKIRHWSDWHTRWSEAHPAPVRVALRMEALAHELKVFPWGAKPRSRRQALLWEGPFLFISACLIATGFLLIAIGPADA